MPLTVSDLEQLQSQLFADDVPFPPEATAWNESEAIAFFESGGVDVPTAKAHTKALHPAASSTSHDNAIDDSGSDLMLTNTGKVRFASAPPTVFTTRSGCRLVYQLSPPAANSNPSKVPIVIQGGGLSGRAEVIANYGAESPMFARHPVLIFDRRGAGASGASDVHYAECDVRQSQPRSGEF